MVAPEPKSARLARTAREVGQAAIAAGDLANGIRWLDRAHRLAPRDGNIILSLAAAYLGQDDRRAADLFAAVAAEWDRREAWLGLAGARLRLSDHDAAAVALANALARHMMAAGIDAMADSTALSSGALGWCGLQASGVVVMVPTRDGPATLHLDGKRVTGTNLPKRWVNARQLTVTLEGRHFLGSPIDIAAISRTVGCVENWEGGVRGWAWHPGDPLTSPELTISGPSGRPIMRITAVDESIAVADNGPLSRPRGFSVTLEQLSGHDGPLHVRGRDGFDLFGSPLDPGREQRAATEGAMAVARCYPTGSVRQGRQVDERASLPMWADASIPRQTAGVDTKGRRVAVVIPVHGRLATVLACLDSVFSTVGAGTRIVVVDDASPDPDLTLALEQMAQQQRIRLLRHDQPQGFPASANVGMVACGRQDVVLLNSDTLVPPGWLERLQAAAMSEPNIGTVTPMSNNASIMTYPTPGAVGAEPDMKQTLRLDRLALRANGDATIDLPVGIGFCLYIKRACLDAVGTFRADIFAQGYGEENDFCLRARHLGWRHVGLPGLFVTHSGGKSFGSAGAHLRRRNEAVLNRLHPGYSKLIERFLREDPLFEARRRLDQARWRAAKTRAQRSVILITHADAGGVERRIEASAASHHATGNRVIVLRPAITADGRAAIVVGEGPHGGFPNLRYVLPDEMAALLRLLRTAHPDHVEIHHFLNHPPAVHDLLTEMGVPYDVHIHDYAWFCPRISLVGGGEHYCGEPDLSGCEACIADHGRLIKENIGVLALRQRSSHLMARARQVVAPSDDVAVRIRRHFPAIRPVVIRHDDDAAIDAPARPRLRNGICRVCVVGSIGLHKGYHILLACARDAAARSLNLEFIVVGDTIDDERLLTTGRVFITGTYKPDEAVELIRSQQASLGLLPSIWPETWSLTLTELWRAGLHAAVFDFGAPGERVRQTGYGFLLPLGLPPPAINNALLAAAGRSGHE